MVNIELILGFALAQAGDEYIENVEVDLDDPDPRAFDCSELVQWACHRAGVVPPMPDGSWLQARHCNNEGKVITTELALKTRGALLFKFDSDPFTTMPVKRHVAISLGDDRTIEAQGSATDVGIFPHAGRRDWRFGAWIPGVDYSPGTSGHTATEEEEDVSILMFLADGKGHAHPYVVSGIVGKHVSSPEALELHKNLQKLAAQADPSKVTILGEGKPLGKEWQDAIALMDGPLRNVS